MTPRSATAGTACSTSSSSSPPLYVWHDPPYTPPRLPCSTPLPFLLRFGFGSVHDIR
jgi:hypothetical protein